MHEEHQIPIWFFIGALLGIYGLLILGSGILFLIHPTPRNVALTNLHADIWWGGLLVIIGGYYTVKFWPSKSAGKQESGKK